MESGMFVTFVPTDSDGEVSICQGKLRSNYPNGPNGAIKQDSCVVFRLTIAVVVILQW